jgi:hypothetical protein
MLLIFDFSLDRVSTDVVELLRYIYEIVTTELNTKPLKSTDEMLQLRYTSSETAKMSTGTFFMTFFKIPGIDHFSFGRGSVISLPDVDIKPSFFMTSVQ